MEKTIETRKKEENAFDDGDQQIDSNITKKETFNAYNQRESRCVNVSILDEEDNENIDDNNFQINDYQYKESYKEKKVRNDNGSNQMKSNTSKDIKAIDSNNIDLHHKDINKPQDYNNSNTNLYNNCLDSNKDISINNEIKDFDKQSTNKSKNINSTGKNLNNTNRSNTLLKSGTDERDVTIFRSKNTIEMPEELPIHCNNEFIISERNMITDQTNPTNIKSQETRGFFEFSSSFNQISQEFSKQSTIMNAKHKIKTLDFNSNLIHNKVNNKKIMENSNSSNENDNNSNTNNNYGDNSLQQNTKGYNTKNNRNQINIQNIEANKYLFKQVNNAFSSKEDSNIVSDENLNYKVPSSNLNTYNANSELKDNLMNTSLLADNIRINNSNTFNLTRIKKYKDCEIKETNDRNFNSDNDLKRDYNTIESTTINYKKNYKDGVFTLNTIASNNNLTQTSNNNPEFSNNFSINIENINNEQHLNNSESNSLNNMCNKQSDINNNANSEININMLNNYNLNNISTLNPKNQRKNPKNLSEDNCSSVTQAIFPCLSSIYKLVIVYSCNGEPLQIMRVVNEDDEMIHLKPLKDYSSNNEFLTSKEELFYQKLSENSLQGILNVLNLDIINELSILKNLQMIGVNILSNCISNLNLMGNDNNVNSINNNNLDISFFLKNNANVDKIKQIKEMIKEEVYMLMGNIIVDCSFQSISSNLFIILDWLKTENKNYNCFNYNQRKEFINLNKIVTNSETSCENKDAENAQNNINLLLETSYNPLFFIRCFDYSLSKYPEHNEYQLKLIFEFLTQRKLSNLINKEDYLSKLGDLLLYLDLDCILNVVISKKSIDNNKNKITIIENSEKNLKNNVTHTINLDFIPIITPQSMLWFKETSILLLSKSGASESEVEKMLELVDSKNYIINNVRSLVKSIVLIKESKKIEKNSIINTITTDTNSIIDFLIKASKRFVIYYFELLIITLYLLKQSDCINLFRQMFYLLFLSYILKQEVTELKQAIIKSNNTGKKDINAFAFLYTMYSNLSIIVFYNFMIKIIKKELNTKEEDGSNNSDYKEKYNINLVFNNTNKSIYSIFSELLLDQTKESDVIDDTEETLLSKFLDYNLKQLFIYISDKEYKLDFELIAYLEGFLGIKNLIIESDLYLKYTDCLSSARSSRSEKYKNINEEDYLMYIKEKINQYKGYIPVYTAFSNSNNKNSRIKSNTNTLSNKEYDFSLSNSILELYLELNVSSLINKYKKPRIIKQIWNVKLNNLDEYIRLNPYNINTKIQKQNEFEDKALTPLKFITNNKLIDYITFFQERKTRILISINDFLKKYYMLLELSDTLLELIIENINHNNKIDKVNYTSSINSNNDILDIDKNNKELYSKIASYLNTFLWEIQQMETTKYINSVDDNFVYLNPNTYVLLSSLMRNIFDEQAIMIQKHYKRFLMNRHIKKLKTVVIKLQNSIRYFLLRKNNFRDLQRSMLFASKYKKLDPYIIKEFSNVFYKLKNVQKHNYLLAFEVNRLETINKNLNKRIRLGSNSNNSNTNINKIRANNTKTKTNNSNITINSLINNNNNKNVIKTKDSFKTIITNKEDIVNNRIKESMNSALIGKENTIKVSNGSKLELSSMNSSSIFNNAGSSNNAFQDSGSNFNKNISMRNNLNKKETIEEETWSNHINSNTNNIINRDVRTENKSQTSNSLSRFKNNNNGDYGDNNDKISLINKFSDIDLNRISNSNDYNVNDNINNVNNNISNEQSHLQIIDKINSNTQRSHQTNEAFNDRSNNSNILVNTSVCNNQNKTNSSLTLKQTLDKKLNQYMNKSNRKQNPLNNSSLNNSNIPHHTTNFYFNNNNINTSSINNSFNYPNNNTNTSISQNKQQNLIHQINYEKQKTVNLENKLAVYKKKYNEVADTINSHEEKLQTIMNLINNKKEVKEAFKKFGVNFE